MTAVDEDASMAETEGLERRGDFGNAAKVGAGSAASEDDVDVGIAERVDSTKRAIRVEAQMNMRHRRRETSLNRTKEFARSGVFEANRKIQVTGPLAVRLGLDGASAHRTPGEQVGDVKVGKVENFRGTGNFEFGNFQQERSGSFQARIDVA